ncbi:MAG: D-2-hydroxyacid dehydrogenase [Armatimonadetes bacterium]|nr:D-2-hydroxyacid dehydrogenase [Armatimonadota bacterium]MCX7967734.1 D-2-hydroxyacid dehydrogenase [Armatimonadota bacterium]MDW8142746.1 D-2-hydroxyacid dehydrogenase [Armatimonadota bacterium]
MKLLITHDLTPQQLEQVRLTAREHMIVYTQERDLALTEARDTDIALLGAFAREILETATNLKWAHIPWAGVDSLIETIRKTPAIVTCGKGVFDAPMADHVFALMLTLTRQINIFLRYQIAGVWRRELPNSHLTDLWGKTMGIVGLGNIGREVARRASAFGMRVLAVKRRPSAISEEPVDGLFLGYEGLRLMLPECDFVVITAALTPQTRYLLGRNELASMKKGSILINVARGALIDEQALVEALSSGQLAGAGLDVFENEPLPPNSPLWHMPNVVITPHVGGLSERTRQRVFERFLENLRRFISGEPLIGVVDKDAGY